MCTHTCTYVSLQLACSIFSCSLTQSFSSFHADKQAQTNTATAKYKHHITSHTNAHAHVTPQVEEAEVIVADTAGEAVDNKMRLDVIKQQEELIKEEAEERKMVG